MRQCSFAWPFIAHQEIRQLLALKLTAIATEREHRRVPGRRRGKIDLIHPPLRRTFHRIDERARRLFPEVGRREAGLYPTLAEVADRPRRFGGFFAFLSSVAIGKHRSSRASKANPTFSPSLPLSMTMDRHCGSDISG
jgi:hypothetical protein